MFCKNCGKEIDDNAVVCIHCGAATGKLTDSEKKVNGLGVAGFVIGLLSIFLNVYFCIASVIAIVLSAVGIKKAKQYSVNGLAVAGLVISILSLLIWGLVWILVGTILISVIS